MRLPKRSKRTRRGIRIPCRKPFEIDCKKKDRDRNGANDRVVESGFRVVGGGGPLVYKQGVETERTAEALNPDAVSLAAGDV